jgi:hypothetical protein
MAEPLNEIVQRTLSEAAARLVPELENAQVEARTSVLESLDAAVRRLRQTSSITDIGAALLETASAWAERVALFVHRGDTLTGWRAIGFDCAMEISVSQAPALAQAIETGEAVISLAVADHLSEALVTRLGLESSQKVYLFPLCLRRSVVALLYADGAAQPAALELLSAVAELAIEAVSSRPQPREKVAEPDRLDLPGARPTPRAPTDWDKMSPEERDIHLRAQRFARVLVADLQLYRSQEIREGKRARNLYGQLREEIDKSREVYLRKFGQSAAAGIDYFHLELLHTLAENQEELLGPDYPGPMTASLVG